MAVISPLVNGNYYSFANIEWRINGLFVLGIKSINYGHKVNTQFVRGTNALPLGMTQGQYEPHADVEVFRPQWDLLMASLSPLGLGYMNTASDMTVTYGNSADNAGLPTVTDTLIGARIVQVELTNADGVDASSVKLTLMPLQILLNGTAATYSTLPQIGAVG